MLLNTDDRYDRLLGRFYDFTLFSKILNHYIDQRGLQAKELAILACIGESTISAWRRDHYMPKNSDQVALMLKALNLTRGEQEIFWKSFHIQHFVNNLREQAESEYRHGLITLARIDDMENNLDAFRKFIESLPFDIDI